MQQLRQLYSLRVKRMWIHLKSVLTSFVAPVIGQCSDVIVNADNSANENVIFTWTAADFGLPVQILYSVYLTSGENSALLGTSSTTSYAISKGDLNGVVINSLGLLLMKQPLCLLM